MNFTLRLISNVTIGMPGLDTPIVTLHNCSFAKYCKECPGSHSFLFEGCIERKQMCKNVLTSPIQLGMTT